MDYTYTAISVYFAFKGDDIRARTLRRIWSIRVNTYQCRCVLQYNTIQYNIALLPSVNTLIARGMLCGAKYTHHTFTAIMKHLITNAQPSEKAEAPFLCVIFNQATGRLQVVNDQQRGS